jgi:DNA-binding MarR family transcriptional regulator
MTTAGDLPDLVLRLARLADGEGWANGLNPAQAAALAYLSRANRFSRAPSHLADWLGTTRGTVSQTLRSLAAKGLVAEGPSPRDRRSITYALTDAGHAALSHPSALSEAVASLPPDRAASAAEALADLLRTLLARQGQRPFGLCHTCRHHRPNPDGSAFCTLLSVQLHRDEAAQLCIEHAA